MESVKKIGSRYRYIVSTESVDCDGERILLSAFEKLGTYPLLLEHEGNDRKGNIDTTKAVGTATVFIRDAQLLADVEITDEKVRAAVDADELPKASIGFNRLATEKTEKGTYITTQAQLLEVSLVKAGCNYDANRVKAVATEPEVKTEEQEKPCACASKHEEPVKASFVDVVNALALVPSMIRAAVETATADLNSKLVEMVASLEAMTFERDAALAKVKELTPEPVKVHKLTAEEKKKIYSAVSTALQQTTRSVVNHYTGRLD